MIIKLLFTLIPLTKFGLVKDTSCPPNGPNKAAITANFHDPRSNGYLFLTYCKNYSNDQCPQELDAPYKQEKGQKCSLTSHNKYSGEETDVYTCELPDYIKEFKAKAESKGWKCEDL